jgi:hypothetical protein
MYAYVNTYIPTSMYACMCACVLGDGALDVVSDSVDD